MFLFTVFGVFGVEYERGNSGSSYVHPFNIPPGSRIDIHEVINGLPVPNHVLRGPLQPVTIDNVPSFNNQNGHAFVILDNGDRFYAHLDAVRGYNDHAQNHVDQIYQCYITRPHQLGLEALLEPFNSVRQMSGLARVYFVASPNINVAGTLQHSDFVTSREVPFFQKDLSVVKILIMIYF